MQGLYPDNASSRFSPLIQQLIEFPASHLKVRLRKESQLGMTLWVCDLSIRKFVECTFHARCRRSGGVSSRMPV
jgi:hypothetical protein